MCTLYRALNAGFLWVIMTLIALGFAVTTGLKAQADDSVIATKFSCKNPEVPTLFLTVESPREAAVIDHALRTGVCQHTEDAIPVIPAYFLRRVRATPTSVEPYGYIWAIRLTERQMAYWFFWKDEHETMLKTSPGI